MRQPGIDFARLNNPICQTDENSGAPNRLRAALDQPGCQTFQFTAGEDDCRAVVSLGIKIEHRIAKLQIDRRDQQNFAISVIVRLKPINDFLQCRKFAGLERTQDRGLSIQRALERRVDPGPIFVLLGLFQNGRSLLPAFATGVVAGGVTS